MKNKKNWLVLGALIAFIVGYQFFVVAPWQKKHAPTPVTATTPATEASVPTPVATGAGVSPPVAGAAPTATALKQEERNNLAQSFTLFPQRTLKIYPDGGFGHARFEDYVERGSKEKKTVELLQQGFHWTSSDKVVQSCLDAMRPTHEAYTFEGKSQALVCRAQYKSKGSQGLFNVALSISGLTAAQANQTIEFLGVDDLGKGPTTEHRTVTYNLDDKTKWVRDSDIFENSEMKVGKVKWFAWGDKYFATFLMQRGEYNPNIRFGQSPTKDFAFFGFQYPLVAKQNAPTFYEFDAYVGTRDVDILAAIDPSLKDGVDLGFTASIARLMLWLLKKIYTFVGNYGVAIILLTLLVRVVLWPLNRKAYASSAKMRLIQPKVKSLQARYKDKPKDQMNLELMNLYKSEKVNPVGGCLPILAQMPIFIGLYGALNHSLDLYQAPFFGWLQDLSSPDRFYILPVLWTATLMGYMAFNPQATMKQEGMPDMRWIMYGMNLFIGFLSKDWPAGLLVYLVVNNLVGITQQFVMQRSTTLQPVEGV